MEVFVTGILSTFGNDNINCRMCFSSIGIGIGNGNVIWFFNYNRNRRRGSQRIQIWIRIRNSIRFGIDNGGIC